MDENFEVRNVSEDLVDMYLDDCIKNSECCKCPRCRADIRAYTLNNFPAHYVVTDFGDTMTKLMTMSLQFQADIIAVITRAIIVIGENPRH